MYPNCAIFAKKTLILLLALLFMSPEGVLGNSNAIEENGPDTLSVHGLLLNGWIRDLNSEGIMFETTFGKGEIKIDYADIEQIASKDPFRIYYGDDQFVQGWIIGLKKGMLLVAESQESIVSIQTGSIVTGLSVQKYETSWMSQKRTDFRHWNASLNFGFQYERTAVDKDKLEFGLNVTRRKSATRFVFDFNYAYELQNTAGGVEVTTKDELAIFLLGEYDLHDQWFLFVRPAVEQDQPRLIESRLYPAAGIGYQIYEDKNYLLHLPFGFGYVDEDFIDFSNNTYLSGYIGFEGFYTFNNGVKLSGNLLYMPSLDNPDEEWLFRFDFDVKIPLIEPVSLLFRVTNVNDNNPAPEVGENKFKTSLSLSLDF